MSIAFRQAMALRMRFAPDQFDRPGVSISADPERAESHVTAGYVFGEHLAITCDPAVESMLQAALTIDPTLDSWDAFATDNGGELLGAGRMQLLRSHNMPEVALAPGYTARSLDREDPADVALIQQLADESTEDDLDQVELDMNQLNTPIHVLVDDVTGAIAAFADSYEFDMAEAFHDVGVLTTPAHRGKSLGKVVIKSICETLIASGREPLYRCDESNEASVRLSAGLGFEPVTRLTAYRFTAAAA